VTVYYLHGFASSARSAKAAYFAERLSPYGVRLRCPDFNLPDFETLTMTRMLDRLAADLRDEAPAAVMGSSLGGRLAILAAARLPRQVDRMVLLAPAVIPAQTFLPPDRMDAWQRDGWATFFHYADGRDRPLHYRFYEDLAAQDPFQVTFEQPALVFQGVRDPIVDRGVVEQWAAGRPNVTLTLLDDDHQLMASLPRIWADVETFLELR
jgi:hypothetical protein